MRVPSGSHVLAAVLLPNKLDFKKFTFTTLDEPGAASPAPHLPLTGGVDRALSYLRDQGIDGIIATAGSAYGPYNLEAAQDYLNASVPYYRIGAKTTVEWDALVLQFQHRFLTYKVGRLRYISFDRPRTT